MISSQMKMVPSASDFEASVWKKYSFNIGCVIRLWYLNIVLFNWHLTCLTIHWNNIDFDELNDHSKHFKINPSKLMMKIVELITFHMFDICWRFFFFFFCNYNLIVCSLETLLFLLLHTLYNIISDNTVYRYYFKIAIIVCLQI